MKMKNGNMYILLALLAVMVASCASANLPQAEPLPEQSNNLFPSEEVVLDSPQTAEIDQEDQPDSPSEQSAEEDLALPVQTYGDLFLFSPIRSTETYLMNAEGQALYTWQSVYTPSHSVYLLDNGNLLRTGNLRSNIFDAGGAGGIVEEIAPDGRVVWDFEYANSQVLLHHDVEQMPNGNILMIAWEKKTDAEAMAAGRDPALLRDGELWSDHIIEVDPITNEIVWEWHVWDHLVQAYDASLTNFGSVSDHPELIDLNYTVRQAGADWNHFNSIDYNAELDQILLSVHAFSEIWIIDHNTSSAEAAGSAGDLLYRWGNPQAYGSGTANDQQLYYQHDAQWIEEGLSGQGNILIFSNGDRRERPFSSIEEITPPLNPDGSYSLVANSSFGPSDPSWTFIANDPGDFFADHISGAQRLANGNTLICSGTDGRFFEVSSAGEIVWEYEYGGSVFRLTQIDENDTALSYLDLSPGDVLIGTAQNNGGPPN